MPLCHTITPFPDHPPVFPIRRPQAHLSLDASFNGNIYLFEFKVVETTPAGAAKTQLKSLHYADKYRNVTPSLT